MDRDFEVLAADPIQTKGEYSQKNSCWIWDYLVFTSKIYTLVNNEVVCDQNQPTLTPNSAWMGGGCH